MRTALTLLLLLLLLLATPCLAAPQVLVSIAPLHSLVSILTKGVSEPGLLMSQSASPHSASLRPSQARALAAADLMIWVGPELESFLARPVTRLVKPEAEMQLLKLDNLKLLPQRQGGFWEEDHQGDTDHGEDADHAEKAEHHHRSINPHFWLSPENARQTARSVAKRLVQIDTQHQTIYQRNLTDLLQRIDGLEQSLRERLAPLKNLPYLVFHDAYPYFEEAFALNAIGSIRISAERAPGARRLEQIRVKLTESDAVCLFSEPQFSPALAERLAAGRDLKLATLDPLGSLSAQGEDAWFDLMNQLANNLIDCLAGEVK